MRFFSLYLFLNLYISLFSTFSKITQACHDIDKAALLDFKNSISYDAIGYLGTWIDSTDCCTQWDGITCDPTNGRVIRLHRGSSYDGDYGLYMSGIISPSLGNLSYLRVLDLNHLGDIHGEIPSELGNLSNLTQLVLDDNHLSGSIPKTFRNLHNLQEIRLQRNSFSGEIPPSIFTSKSSYGMFDVSYNEFSGVIPSTIGKIRSLGHLSLNDNKFSGTIPSSIGSLKNLRVIDMSRNQQLSGPIPCSFKGLSKLVRLWIPSASLTGTIPSGVLNLPILEELDLSMNSLSGAIPPHKTNFPAYAFEGNVGLCNNPLPPCNP